jgi:peroxiredoxin
MKKTILFLAFLVLLTISARSQKLVTDFSLKNIDEKIVSLNSFKSQKGVIIIFVTNGCPVAELYQKRIEGLQNKYASQGFPVVAINPVDNFVTMKDTASSRHYSYSFLFDSTQNIAKNYHVHANTHTFILLNTPTGFKNVYEGAIDDDYSGEHITKRYVEDAINAILLKKSIRVAKTKVLGCPIDYR